MAPHLFVELFRAIVNARRRLAADSPRALNMANNERCLLGTTVDRFVQAAGPFYCDAELFLRLNEEPVEDF